MFKKYLSASAITIFSSVTTKIIAFLMIAVLTRMISQEDYGEYSLFTTWESIIALIIGGSIASSFGIAKKDFKEKYPDYLNSTLGLSYLLFLVGLLFFSIFRFHQTQLFLLLVVFHSFNMNMLTNYDIRQTFDFKFLRGAVVALLTSVVCFASVVISVYLVKNKDQGMVAIVAWTISHGVIALFCQKSFFTSFKGLFHKQYWKYAARYSFPMVPHNLSLVVLNQMDRIMIDEILSKVFVALYSVIYSLSIVISILWTAIRKVWMTWAYDRLAQNDEKNVIRVNHYLIALMAILVVNYCYVSPEIIKVFLPETYWDGIDIMAPILFGYFYSFLFSIYVNIEYFYKKSGRIVWGTIISAAVNIITNYYFIKKYGYKASAYTTLLSYFVLFFYHYLINFKHNYFHTSILILVSLFLTVVLGIFQLTINSILFRALFLAAIDAASVLIILRILKQNNMSVRDLVRVALKK